MALTMSTSRQARVGVLADLADQPVGGVESTLPGTGADGERDEGSGHVVGFGAFVVEQVDHTLGALEGQRRATRAEFGCRADAGEVKTIHDGSGRSGRQRLGPGEQRGGGRGVPVEHERHRVPDGIAR